MCGELTTLPGLSKKTLFKLGQRGRLSGPFLLQVEYSRVTSSPVSFRGLGAALDWRTRTRCRRRFSDLYGFEGGVHRRGRKGCRSLPRVIDAVAFVNEVNTSASLLDIRLTLESVVPVAIQLTDRRIPFVFYTGYPDTGEIREKFPHSKILHKPASPEILVDAIAEVLSRTAPPPRYIRRRLVLLVIGLVAIVTLVLCIY